MISIKNKIKRNVGYTEYNITDYIQEDIKSIKKVNEEKPNDKPIVYLIGTKRSKKRRCNGNNNTKLI